VYCKKLVKKKKNFFTLFKKLNNQREIYTKEYQQLSEVKHLSSLDKKSTERLLVVASERNL